MTTPTPKRRSCARRGAATVELAILLPVLTFITVIGCDFARLFYASVTLGTCARNGALYESDPYTRAESPYKTAGEAALADASNLTGDPSNLPTVDPTVTGADETGRPYVEVTVRYRFRTIVSFPGVPTETNLARTVRVAEAPPNPTY
jgi:Flp pilus assembly protein TadG